VEGDSGGAKLGVGVVAGATDTITGDRMRLGGRGSEVVRQGGRGAALATGSQRDVWRSTMNVVPSATTWPLERSGEPFIIAPILIAAGFHVDPGHLKHAMTRTCCLVKRS
jgi:hypothetical protein